MSSAFRKPEILALARRDGRVTVDDLAARFGVTAQTVRRDLAALCDSGQLGRVHGGAVVPAATANIAYSARQALNRGAKGAIAAAVAGDICGGATVFLNIGTSTEAVAAALLDHRDMLVVTNNLNVANILRGNDGCAVIVTGGSLRPSDGGLVGPLAMKTVGEFKFDIAVIGCSALDADGDLLDYDLDEIGVSQCVLRQARQRFVVADATKLDRAAPARIASLSEVDAIYTDAPPPPALARLCAGWSTRVVVAPA